MVRVCIVVIALLQHVVFGRVLEGLDVIKAVENTATAGRDRPITEVTIESCGELLPPKSSKSGGGKRKASDDSDSEGSESEESRRRRKQRKKEQKAAKKEAKKVGFDPCEPRLCPAPQIPICLMGSLSTCTALHDFLTKVNRTLCPYRPSRRNTRLKSSFHEASQSPLKLAV
jgi:hypothetical protein